MGTVTATLLTLGQSRAATSSYTVQAPQLARLGMCPVNSTSVSDLQAIFARFPKVNAVRFFSATTFVPWSSALWAAIPDTVRRIAYSTKTIQPTADINAYWNQLPARFRQPGGPHIDWIWAHEPEQQSGGDPLPATYRAEYQRLGQIRLAHPTQQYWGLGPCFTEYRALRDGEAWWNDYGVVGCYPGVTRVGYDIYDTGYEQEFPNGYRTPAHMLSGLFSYRVRVNSLATDGVIRTANVDEWGIALDLDVDSQQAGDDAAAAMVSHWNYFRQHPGAGSMCWFDRGGCFLGDSSTDPAGRPMEYQAFASLVSAL